MADRPPIRVGIVGTGLAARFHYDGYRQGRGVPVEIVGVTSRARGEGRECYGLFSGPNPRLVQVWVRT